ncbi:MAG TPA: ribosome biogenesis GTP-binding protein YihA/YsxC [Selenomonadales bacterium]|nr:ribosome biogenesis GTP-binding protein YihA/YsxC [Selenomonadales bacterium]
MTATETLSLINAKYTASAVRADQYPAGDYAEIALIGRSNVGKSSLINSLCRHGGLARTSGSPGKTQTLNFYTVTLKTGEEGRHPFFLVDLPGYGYARVGRESRRQWAQFIDAYLSSSPRLGMVCQLIDIRHPPMDSDIEALRRLKELGQKIQVVATKADKISRMAVRKHCEIIRRDLGLGPEARIIPYSAPSGAGREELLDEFKQILLK